MISASFTAWSHLSTYLAGFGLTVLPLLAGFLLHSKFIALGGPNHYVARE
jgi:hypothetical protein